MLIVQVGLNKIESLLDKFFSKAKQNYLYKRYKNIGKGVIPSNWAHEACRGDT